MPGLSARHLRLPSFLLAMATVCMLAFGTPRTGLAQVGSERYSSIVIDAASGTVLSAVSADEYRFPASLTKMMTIYMLFEALRDHRVAFTQAVPVSLYAASMSPTKLGLLPGTYITVEQALLGLVTKSANDAAAALGEMMGGDEERFAQMMTLRARALGMSRTTFRNASGLPDWNQVTTARDMAVLARHLVQDFPSLYHYFSTPYYQFQGRTIYNHQRLLQSYPGADGLKTGYTEASGYNVVTSAVRGDTRLIGVVLGASSGGERDVHTASLMDAGFDRMGVPMYMARRDPPPVPFHLPAFISLAHATPQFRQAPTLEPEPPRARARPGRAVVTRRAPEPFERVHARPVAAYPMPPLPGPRARDSAPARASSNTRTAHGAVSGRYRG